MRNPLAILRPAAFHGARKLREHGRGRRPRHPFFEGWYFKLVSADRRTRLALIPGVFLSDDGSVAEAFVQVLNGVTGATEYHRFELKDFEASEHDFQVRIGANHFSDSRIVLDLPGLRGEIGIGSTRPWPVTLREPGAMGWFGWVPTMECYHGVVSFDHPLTGALTAHGQELDLSGGRGYIEKDWGSNFPSGYVWMQSNHFEGQGVSLVASTALIPWRSSIFRGDLVGLWLPDGPDAGLHRFTTYTRARTESLVANQESVTWKLRSPKGHTLRLKANMAGKTSGVLHAPVRTEMHQRVAETLDGSVEVVLRDMSGRLLFGGVGECAGVEVHGDVDRLVSTAGR